MSRQWDWVDWFEIVCVTAIFTLIMIAILAGASGAEARDRRRHLDVETTWDGGVRLEDRNSGESVYIAPPGDDATERVHCSHTGKTTTCLRW